MNRIDSFKLTTRITGMVITALFLYAVVMEIIWGYEGGSRELFNFLINTFTDLNMYRYPPALYIFFLVGYAIVWWKELTGSIIIIVVSITGLIVSHHGDVRLSYLLTLLVGILYLLYWNDRRRVKNKVL